MVVEYQLKTNPFSMNRIKKRVKLLFDQCDEERDKLLQLHKELEALKKRGSSTKEKREIIKEQQDILSTAATSKREAIKLFEVLEKLEFTEYNREKERLTRKGAKTGNVWVNQEKLPKKPDLGIKS